MQPYAVVYGCYNLLPSGQALHNISASRALLGLGTDVGDILEDLEVCSFVSTCKQHIYERLHTLTHTHTHTHTNMFLNSEDCVQQFLQCV